MSGNLQTVQCFTELGADVLAINRHRNGVVELCAFKQHVDILDFFLSRPEKKVPVWKKLNKFLVSENNEESEAAGKTLAILTKKVEDGKNPNWQPALDGGVLFAVLKVLDSSRGDNAKVQCSTILTNMIEMAEVKNEVMSIGGIPIIVEQLNTQNKQIVLPVVTCLKELCRVKEFAEVATELDAVPALVKVTKNFSDPEILMAVASTLRNIAGTNYELQTVTGRTDGLVSSICGLLENCTAHKPLILALSELVITIVKTHQDNQNSFVQARITVHIISLTKVKNRDVQCSAVNALYHLVEDNPQTQRRLLDEGCVNPLITLLRKSRQPNLQEKTAKAVWALAGDDASERRKVANLVGVPLLIDFLTASFDHLHFIGSEGLGVLAQGPLNKQTAIGEANGIHSLVRLLKSSKEHIVISVVRTLRHLCAGVAYVPHVKNQKRLAQSRGIKFLVAIMAHSENELLQVEAAYTLGCAAMGRYITF